MQTGTQILTGFLLALAFQPAFADLDDGQRTFYLVLVVLSALSSIVALAPVALHRILFQQRAKPQVVAYGHAALITSLVTVSVLARRRRGVRLRRRRRPVGGDRRRDRAASVVLACGSSRPPCIRARLDPQERTGDFAGSHTTAIAVAQFAPAADKAANLAVDRAARRSTASDRGASLVVFPEYSSYFVDPFDDSLAANAEDIDGPFVARADRTRRRARRAHRRRPARARRRRPARAQHRGRRRRVGRRRDLPQAPPLRRVRPARVGLGRGRGAGRARDVRAGRPAVRADDLLRPEVPRGRPHCSPTPGADVFLVPAEWVRGPLKEHHWRTLVHARAIENTVFVAAADHPPPLGVGNSMIVDPQGVEIAAIGTATDVVVAHLDRDAVAARAAGQPGPAAAAPGRRARS